MSLFTKLLILGSNGMLGSEFVRQLQLRRYSHTLEYGSDYEVAAWDQSEIDITDEKEVKEKINVLSPEVIINCAAYNNVDKAENEDRELAMKVNGEAVGYLAQAAVDCGAIFVHYSTDYVFQGGKVEGYKEDDEPEPGSWYAKTKYYGEQKLINLKSETRNPKQFQNPNPKYQIPDIRYYLIRTSRLFGPAGTGEGAKKGFVETILRLGKERGELDLIDEETSSPTYVKDLVEATLNLLGFPPFRARRGKEGLRVIRNSPQSSLALRGGVSGIYHITNSGACTWYGWAKEIFTLTGLSVKLNPVPASKFSRPAPRPKHSILLNTKLPPMRSWQEALVEYLSIEYLKT